MDSIRNGKPVVEDAVFGFRAAAPCLACNDSYFQNKVIHWDPENMRILSWKLRAKSTKHKQEFLAFSFVLSAFSYIFSNRAAQPPPDAILMVNLSLAVTVITFFV